MKSHLILLIFLATLISCSAQQDISKSNASLEWFTNIDLAKKAAAENQKNILMVFAGSDWCKPCIQFKKDVLQNEMFNGKHGNDLVVLYLDFPSRKKNKLPEAETEHNEALAGKYNASGAFPKVVLFDSTMNKLKTLEFSGQSAEDFSNLFPK